MIYEIGGIQFNGDLDELGVEWGLRRPDGWFGAPSLRGDGPVLPLRDGVRVADRYRNGRVISLSGGIAHQSRDTTEAALDQLIAALNLVRVDGQFIAYEAAGTKFATVRRASPIDVMFRGPVCVWGATLLAADWRKYELAEQVDAAMPFVAATEGLDFTLDSGVGLAIDLTLGSGAGLAFDFTGDPGTLTSAELTNYGTADVYPLIEFTGPTSGSMTDFQIDNLTTGEQIRIVTAVGVGEVLVADMAAAYGLAVGLPISLGGASRYGSWSSPRTPLTLVPGVNVVQFKVNAGTATGAYARIHFRSGWE